MMVWHGGLSGSAPIKVAEQGHLSSLLSNSDFSFPVIISLSETIFSNMNLLIISLLLLILPFGLYFIGKRNQGKLISISSEEIELEDQIKQLQSKGKNLSKNDIMSFADLEQNRFLWARNMELLGQMTPDDMAITGMKFKRDKLTIKGIALTFEDRKDFEIIDEYVQTLRDNKEFSQNFSRIKYVGHQKVNIRGQNIIRFEVIASIKKGGKKVYS